MKIKTIVSFRDHFTRLLAILLLVTLGPLTRSQAAPVSDLLEKGIYNEATKGDLNAALGFYRQIVTDPAATKEQIAQAQLRLGLCHLKLGDKTNAVAALEKLRQEFPDSEKLLAIMENQMPVLLEDMLTQIEQNYFKEVDRAQLMDTAIRAVMGKLDSRSDYFGPEDLRRFNQTMAQKIVGIGVKLSWNAPNRRIIIDTPLPGSPALRAGIRPGDTIVRIDGKSTEEFPGGQELQTAVKLIQGQEGKPVLLGIVRDALEAVQEITVTRGVVQVETVLGDRPKPEGGWHFLISDRNKIAYIRLTQLGQQTASEMHAALEQLAEAKMRGLILDLRGNPGGLLSEAVAISDLFLSSGTIVTIKGRRGEGQTFTASAPGTFDKFPMAVLIDGKTSSAAEIIAASLQDNNRAGLVGERTGGEGLVKSLISVEDGQSALKLPTAAFYRPNGKNIHRSPDAEESDEWGVRPDEGYEIIWTEDEARAYQQYRRDRDAIGNPPATAVQFEDTVLQKGLDYVLGKLASR
jgi:carboxyl-terminal processing protease